MRSENLLIGELTIEVTRKKNLKNLYIRVKPPEGDITVSAPTGITMDEVKLFVLGKLQEITKVRDRMLSQERQSKREYVSGESHYLWGKPYRLQVIYVQCFISMKVFRRSKKLEFLHFLLMKMISIFNVKYLILLGRYIF